jgi:hypothetical protein
MKRSIALVILPFCCRLLVSCASFDAGNGSALYNDRLANEDSVYFVQVPASSSSQDLSDAIIEETARQIFIRKGVSARYSITGDGAGRRTSGQIDFNRGNLYALSGQLETLKTVTTKNGVQALVRYRGKDGFKNVALPSIRSLGKNGNPDWVDNPPSGFSFYASVEVSSARAGAADGFQNADTMAIASLARFMGKESSSGSSKAYQGAFSGAYIARRWYNPSMGTYYSLAVVSRMAGNSSP